MIQYRNTKTQIAKLIQKGHNTQTQDQSITPTSLSTIKISVKVPVKDIPVLELLLTIEFSFYTILFFFPILLIKKIYIINLITYTIYSFEFKFKEYWFLRR